MPEYIEREALIAFLESSHDDRDWLVNQYNADWICSWIESQPASDVVAVVRCKDCEYGVWDKDEELWKCVISADWNEELAEWLGFVEYHEADYFCGYGERRGEDE